MTKHGTNGQTLQIIASVAENPNHNLCHEAKVLLASFKHVESTFFEEVHPNVDAGLAYKESAQAVVEGRLPHIFTTHGSHHVRDLIRSIDKIVESIVTQSPADALSPTESYILLCAAHVHDTANVRGRKGHVDGCKEVIREFSKCFVNDTRVVQGIYDVARVHGGEHENYGRDTFRSLSSESTEPRVLLLAAILRLADELSENPARVPATLAAAHAHSYRSQLAHWYAKSFTRFTLQTNTLSLVYNLTPELINSPQGKNEKYQTFLEFLEQKLNRIEQEVIYCTNYARPSLDISLIRVQLVEYDGELPLAKEVKRHTFELHLYVGYPGDRESLCQRSPQLLEKKITHLSDLFPPAKDGKSLAACSSDGDSASSPMPPTVE